MKKYLFYDIFTIYGRDMKHFFKDRSHLFLGITQPILWFLLLGFGLNGLIGENPNLGVSNYITYILPGIMVMTAMSGGLFGGAGICNDVRFGYINKMLSSPISRSAIILGKTLSSTIQTCFQVFIVVVFSLCFGAKVPLNLNLLWALIFLSAFCSQMCSIGEMAAVKLKNHQAVYGFLGTLNVPLMFTCSAFFPTETMPSVMKVISYINPLTYAINSIRGVMYGADDNLLLNVAVLISESVFFIFTSVIVFKKEYEG